MTNFEKIILTAFGALIVIVLLIGAIIFRQQKTINALTEGAGTSKQAAIQTSAPKKSPSLAETIKQFSGKIENISGNKLIISTNLSDLSKPKNPEKIKNTGVPVNFSQDDFEVIVKSMTVNINDKTFFASKKLADLKIGDMVFVMSDKSPYSSDAVMAKKITFIELPK